MRTRFIKKIENRYLDRNDILRKTSQYVKEMSYVESEIAKFYTNLTPKVFLTETKQDLVLESFIKSNSDLLLFDKNYLQTKFLTIMSSLEPKEFKEFDSLLQQATNDTERLELLFLHGFQFSFFEQLQKGDLNDIEIDVLFHDDFIVTEQENIESLVGFEFNYLSPFAIFLNLKTGTGKESIKPALVHLSYTFTEEVTYDDTIKQFISIPYKTTTKQKKKHKKTKKFEERMVERKDYLEQFNKRYLFSSIDNKFYTLIQEHTVEIHVRDKELTFVLDHDLMSQITISI